MTANLPDHPAFFHQLTTRWVRWRTTAATESAWEAPLGWTCLLLLLAAPLMPGMNSEMNAATGLGAALLLYRWLGRRPGLLQNRWLFWGIGLFFASAVASSVIPSSFLSDPYGRMLLASNHLWHTGRGLIAAGLCLLLLRRREEFLALFGFLLLMILLVDLWAPIDHWLRGNFYDMAIEQGRRRLEGTKGNSARFSAVLFLTCFFPWMLFCAPNLRNRPLPEWAKRAGYLLAVLIPLALLFKIELLDLGGSSGWLPGGPRQRGAINGSFYILCILIISIGILLWRSFCRDYRTRAILCIAALLLLFFNIGLTTTRLPLALALLASGAIVLLRGGWVARIGVVAVAVATAGGLCLILTYPGALTNSTSLRQRASLWSGACEQILHHPLLGLGYGTDTTGRAWSDFVGRIGDIYGPVCERYYIFTYAGETLLSNASHMHNLWIQLLLERGIVGTAAFHILWIITLVLLWKTKGADPKLRRLARCAAVFLALLAVHGLVEFPIRKTDEILYWAIPAIGLAALRIPPEPSSSTDDTKAIPPVSGNRSSDTA